MAITLPQRLAVATPRVNDTPLDLADAMAQWGGKGALADAEQLLGDQHIYAVLRSRTMKDVGLWVWFPRIWLFVGDGSLHLAAWAGKRSYRHAFIHKVVSTELKRVMYNDITSSLLIDDIHPTPIPALRCEPAVGYSLVAHIERYISSC